LAAGERVHAEAGASNEPVLPLSAWQAPPPEARPVARWWWPGGSVEAEAVERHLQAIAAAGFGAVELQPLLLGIGPDELAADEKLRTVGTPGFRKAVAHAVTSAARQGLAFDLTLGSGWPGGLPTAKVNAEQQLLMAEVEVQGGQGIDIALPAAPDQSYRRAVEWVLDVLGPPDDEPKLVTVLAGRVTGERGGVPILVDVRDVGAHVRSGRLVWSAPSGTWRVITLYAGSTEHFVMGGAFPGEEADARVIDHLSRRGADALLEGYADPVLAEVGAGNLRGAFVDSFELLGELPFTEAFAREFERRAGYDATPWLPFFFRAGGESKYAEMMDVFGRLGGPRYVAPDALEAERAREDYERVRRELFEEVFIARFVEWAHTHGLELRLQAHGGYGDVLDTYALADVPESEALFGAGSHDFLSLAASAAHVAGRTWSSSESFITLRLLGTDLSRDEMRLLAGRAYAAGINRLVYHGVAQPYERSDGARWFPFPGGFGRILAGPLPMSLDVDVGALKTLPEFNLFLSRLSVAMSHGEPVADVAWLRADPAYPDAPSLQVGRIEPHAGESAESAAFRARGLGVDRVSRRMLAGARLEKGRIRIGAATYRALVLDPIQIAEPGLVERVAAIAESGVPVLALGALPKRAPGLHEAAARDARVRAAAVRIEKGAIRVSDGTLEARLAEHVRNDLVGPRPGERFVVSLERRTSARGDTLLLFNESWSPRATHLRFSRGGGALVRWDPRSGAHDVLRPTVTAGDVVEVDLEPAETLLLTLEWPTRRSPAARPERPDPRSLQSVPGSVPR